MSDLVGVWGWLLTQLDMGFGVSQSLCWPASGQGRGPAGSRVGSALLSAGWVRRLPDCGFLAFGVCPLVSEAGPEAGAGFLEGRARAQEILELVAAQWWVELGPGTSGGQGHVQRQVWAQKIFRQPVC